MGFSCSLCRCSPVQLFSMPLFPMPLFPMPLFPNAAVPYAAVPYAAFPYAAVPYATVTPYCRKLHFRGGFRFSSELFGMWSVEIVFQAFRTVFSV
ncbi:hypothetical protein ACOMHN_001694 [Nucella lapillus]